MYCLRNAWILTGSEGRFPARYRSFDLVMRKAHKRRGGGWPIFNFAHCTVYRVVKGSR